jgi:hypothetical protein
VLSVLSVHVLNVAGYRVAVRAAGCLPQQSDASGRQRTTDAYSLTHWTRGMVLL